MDTLCLGHLPQHSWGLWEGFDPIHERDWKYRRACTLSGCTAVEYARDLSAVGVVEVRSDGADPEDDALRGVEPVSAMPEDLAYLAALGGTR